ncbi:MAG: OsmC family protein [Anaerolineales bacterium]
MAQIAMKWVESHLMVGIDSRGNSIVIGSTNQNPNGAGVKPNELLLMSAASCSMYDVIEILTKQREPFRDIQVICSGDQMKDPPYSYTNLHLHYMVFGEVSEEKVVKAIELSQQKYCSVTTTLKGAIPVTYDYEVIP